MQIEKFSEIIAHFIGIFETMTEEMRHSSSVRAARRRNSSASVMGYTATEKSRRALFRLVLRSVEGLR